MKFRSVLVLFALSGSALAKDDPTAGALARLHAAARCDDKASPLRPWCIATAWDKGTADLPKQTLVGVTVPLENGKDVSKALVDNVTFVAFTCDGTKAKLTDIKPTAKGEEATIGEAVGAVAAVFKGKAKGMPAELPKDLAGYIDTLRPTYPVEKTPREWAWKGASASRIRKIGAFWVIIEIPTLANGVWATILTDQWAAKK
jgi:hypothetical protein